MSNPGYIYWGDLPLKGHFANSVSFDINQNAQGTYTSYIKFVSYYPN